mgnify:CR=1 FL=1
MKGYFARKPVNTEDLERAKGWGKAQEIQVVTEVTLSKNEYNHFRENLMLSLIHI